MKRPEHMLRVIALWGSRVLAHRELSASEGLVLGSGSSHLVPRPDGVIAPDCPVRAASGGWEVDPRGATGGLLQVGGQVLDPTVNDAPGYPIGLGDHGILQYGRFAVFFQCVLRAKPRFLGCLRRHVRSRPWLLASAGAAVGVALAYAVTTGTGLVQALAAHFRVRPPASAVLASTPSSRLPRAAGSLDWAEIWSSEQSRRIRRALAALGSPSERLSRHGAVGISVPAAATSAERAPVPSSSSLSSVRGSAGSESGHGHDDGPGAAEIGRIVMAEYEGFRACYGSRQKPGKVTVSWSIAPGGKVSGATIGSSSLHDPRVESCILRQFGRLRFPPADQATHSSFTFTFTPTPE